MPPDLRPEERLLVLAALGDRETARAAWEEWERVATLDATDAASFAVLPAVARNLNRLMISHLLEAKLRGIYKHAWARSQLAFRDVSAVHAALAAGGIRAVALTGLPVIVQYLGDLGAIGVNQVDVLTAGRDVDGVAAALATLGWQAAGRIPPTDVRRAFASHVFEGTNRRRVVVHWRTFPLGCPEECERALLERATVHTIQGSDLLLLEPADQLLFACVRFPALPNEARLQWTVETCAFLQVAAELVDEQAFGERVACALVGKHCVESFAAIHAAAGDQLRLRVPALPVAMRQASSVPERALPRGRVWRAAVAAWHRYAAVCHAANERATPWGFARFATAVYRYEWDVPVTTGLPGAAIRRLWRGEPSAAGSV